MAKLNSAELLKRIEDGDSQAAAAIFDRYVERLLALARARIGPKLQRRIDADDVVQSAYRSFFVHAENQEYAVRESGDLWRLLVRITLNKLYGQVEKHTAARRNIHREEQNEDMAPAGAVSLEPTAAEVIALTEQLRLAINGFTEVELAVFGGQLRGETVEKIAGAIQKSPRTVRRLLAETRQKIEEQLIAEEGKTDTDPGTRTSRSPDPRAPLPYSDFRLERLLGAGGMGKVYRATQINTGKQVAIKALLKSRQADANAVEKFLQEGQILGSLKHASIVGFHGIGRFPGGGYFIVMDFVDGADFQSRIVKKPLSIDEAVRVVRIVAQAIGHAHVRGIVHGDIKPANILIDRADRVVVTDFGLAQFIGATSKSPPWIVGGTAGFIAPEVREHKCLPGRTSDIYGLGALLWSLATGSVPNERDVICGNPSIPPQVSYICGKCLASDPMQRFQRVGEFLESIDRIGVEPQRCGS